MIQPETYNVKAENKARSYKSQKKSEKVADSLSLVAIIILAAAVMLPIWWIFRTSLMTNTQIYAYPPPFFSA